MKAISIQQPWAWLIVNGFKDIENRKWNTKHRGPVLIHTGKAPVNSDEWEVAISIAASKGVKIPSSEDLNYGGIIGVATINECVTESDSPWFFGPVGFCLSDARTISFFPLKGKLSLFETGYEPALEGDDITLIEVHHG